MPSEPASEPASAPASAPAPQQPTQTPPPPAPAGRPGKERRSRAGLIVLVLLLLLPVALCAPLCFVSLPATVSSGTVLELDLEQALDEGAGAPALLGGEGRTLLDALLALRAAKDDDDVVGLVARVGGSGQGLATAQELREAIAEFRASGKPAVAYAETFGEMSPGTSGYALATAFDEVWLQPSGELNLTRAAGEAMFLRGAFDKAGIVPEISQRKEFKNAANQYMQSTLTEAHREAMTSLLASLERQLVDDIAQGRPKLGGAEGVRTLLSGGPLSAQQAHERGLVDKLGYRDEMLAALQTRLVQSGALGAGATPRYLWLHKYAERASLPTRATTGRAVALIVAHGPVTRGRSTADPLSGESSFGSDTVSAALRSAAADDDVAAILLRVDSPGGSYVASDTIWREVARARENGKPVVVSMGDLAASGGYFVAMGGDRVFASRATLTGSIGVFGGKVVTTGMWDKVGVGFETVKSGDDVDASFFSTDEPYSERARGWLEGELDRIYADFTGKAAQGRKLPLDKLEPLAHGRVWSGADAKERGLIDDLGGFLPALDAAVAAGGLTPGAFALREFPRRRPPLEQLLAALSGNEGDNSDDVDAVAIELPAAHALRAAASIAASLDRQVLSAELPRLVW